MVKKNKGDAVETAADAVSHGTPETLVTTPWEDTLESRAAMGLDKDDKVYPIPITVTVAVGDKYLVGSGLKGGERIISEGIIKARPGTQVRVQQAGGQQPQDAAPKK